MVGRWWKLQQTRQQMLVCLITIFWIFNDENEIVEKQSKEIIFRRETIIGYPIHPARDWCDSVV